MLFFYILFIIIITVIFVLICFLAILPKKCGKCGKRSLYPTLSRFLSSETKYRDKETIKTEKDKKGNTITHKTIEKVPYVSSTYENYYECNNCGNIIILKSGSKCTEYKNFNQFKNSKIGAFLVTLIIYLIIFIPLLVATFKYAFRSDNQKLIDFLETYGNGSTYRTSMTIGRYNVGLKLEYYEKGYSFSGSKYNYSININDYPTDSLVAIDIEAAVYFNLEKSNNQLDDFVGMATVKYDFDNVVAALYTGINGSDYFTLSYENSWYGVNDNWDSAYNQYQNEWEFYSWHAIECCLKTLGEICQEAGFSLYNII